MEINNNTHKITAEDSQRIRLVKLWFAIMVVFIHSGFPDTAMFADEAVIPDVAPWFTLLKYSITNVVCSCAVPGYFFFAGLLLYRCEFTWCANMKKKVKTLAVPYLINNTFWILFYLAATNLSIFSYLFSSPMRNPLNWGIIDWVNAYLGFLRPRNGAFSPFLGVLWFVRDLFVLNMLSVILKRIIDRAPGIVLCLLAVFLLSPFETHIFWLRKGVSVFFALGYYAVKYNVRLSSVDRIPAMALAAVYALIIVLCCAFRDTVASAPLEAAAIVAGILFWYRCATRISREPLLSRLLWVSQWGFCIYIFHAFPLSFLIKLLLRFLPATTPFAAAAFFLLPCIIIPCCIAAGWFLARFFPRVYRAVTGSR